MFHGNFINEIKDDEKKYMIKYLKKIDFYHTPLFLAKELYNRNQIRNDKIVKHINDALIESKTDINIKNIPKMKIKMR